MKQIFKAQLQNMSSDEARAMVPASTLETLRAQGDEHPLIRVYSIGHEGTSEGGALTPKGRLKIRVQNLKDAVQRIYDRIVSGTKAFQRHGETNSHAGREAVGWVVGRALREIDGALHSLAAIYILPQHRDIKLDVASYEADCEFVVRPNGDVVLSDIDQITGIALSDSNTDTPAFPGATLRAAFQCFAEGHSQEGGHAMPTLSEIKASVAEHGISPEALFSVEQMIQAPAVAAVLKTKFEQTAHEAKRQITETLTKKLEERETEAKTSAEKIKELERANLLQKSTGVLDKVVGARKLSDQEKGFVSRNFESFSSTATEPAALEADIQKFVDNQLKVREDWLKVEGLKGQANTSGGASAPGTDNTNPDKLPFE